MIKITVSNDLRQMDYQIDVVRVNNFLVSFGVAFQVGCSTSSVEPGDYRPGIREWLGSWFVTNYTMHLVILIIGLDSQATWHLTSRLWIITSCTSDRDNVIITRARLSGFSRFTWHFFVCFQLEYWDWDWHYFNSFLVYWSNFTRYNNINTLVCHHYGQGLK